MINITVSKFSNIKSTNPTSINLKDWLCDATHKDLVYKIRTISDKEEIKKYKSQLPCITPSGEFVLRNANALIKHSGFICVDIDGADNLHLSDFAKVRDELKKIKNIYFVALSVSGKGVYCLIPIKFPEKHKEHFEALKSQFSNIGITIDKSCGDVSRLRIYSYDEDAYFNEDAIVFEQFLEYKVEKSPERISSNIKGNQSKEKTTLNKVISVVTRLNNSSIDITDSYEEWFQIGCAFANEFGEEGRDIFHLVSQNSPKYHWGVCDRLFTTCIEKRYSYGIGTFFHLVEQSGKV